MKNLMCRVLAIVGFAALATVPTLYAQAGAVTADVPFAFAVGDVQFPAGPYSLAAGPANSVVAITNDSNRTTKLALANPVSRGDRHMDGKLVFNLYGNHYFLSQIWRPGETTGRLLPKSKAEREIARAAGGDQTLVAAKVR